MHVDSPRSDGRHRGATAPRTWAWRPTGIRCLATLAMLVVAGPATAQPRGPALLFSDVESGPTTGGPDGLGVPISIFGTGFGSQRGTSRVTIGGVEVAAYLAWGGEGAANPALEMIVVQPGPAVTGGQVVVTVGGVPSTGALSFAKNEGRLLYVASNGSDSGPCSEAEPCAHIGRAIAPTISSAGDTILVRGPLHDEGEIWVRREYGHGGAAGAQKTIKAYPGDGVRLTSGARPFIVDADYVTVSGFIFDNGKSLGIPDAGDANRRRGNRFINNSYAGPVSWSFIDSHGDDHLIAGNACHATGSSVGTQGHCYYVSYGNQLRISHNVGSGAPGYGLHVFDQRRSSSDFRRTITNVIIEGNILTHSTLRSGLIVAMADEGALGNAIEGVIIRNNVITRNSHVGIVLGGVVRGIQIYNNTVVDNGRQSIHVANDVTIAGIDIRNNLLSQATSDACLNDCQWYDVAHVQVGARANGVTVSGNGYLPSTAALVGTSDEAAVTGAVEFVDPARFDFHVRPGAASVDRGVPLASVPFDFDGLPRPAGNGVDLGAFEWPSAAVAPAAPRNVRVVVRE